MRVEFKGKIGPEKKGEPSTPERFLIAPILKSKHLLLVMECVYLQVVILVKVNWRAFVDQLSCLEKSKVNLYNLYWTEFVM